MMKSLTSQYVLKIITFNFGFNCSRRTLCHNPDCITSQNWEHTLWNWKAFFLSSILPESHKLPEQIISLFAITHFILTFPKPGLSYKQINQTALWHGQQFHTIYFPVRKIWLYLMQKKCSFLESLINRGIEHLYSDSVPSDSGLPANPLSPQ